MNINPKISIVLPVYNEEKYIGESIESMLNQSFCDFECIIINDGSVDNTENIIRSFKDQRIRMMTNEENIGLSKSLNKGIRVSKGDYIARMDANDIALESRLEEQFIFMESHPHAAGVFCPVQKVDENGNPEESIEGKYLPSEELQTYLFYKCCFFHSSALLRKEYLPSKPYDSENAAEDYDLWVKLLFKYDLHILDRVLMKVRDLPGGLRFKNKCRQDFLKTKISNLKYLRLIPTKDECDIHLSLENKSTPSDKNLLTKLKWLDKLYIANNTHKVYREPHFTNKLLEHWNGIINNIKQPGSSVKWYYLNSPLKKAAQKPLSRTIKLLFSL
jgi:glycosyltransferase involved in cell wall biosynthesis